MGIMGIKVSNAQQLPTFLRWCGLGAFGMGLAGCSSVVSTIPEREITNLNLSAIEKRLDLHWEGRGSLPLELSELPNVPDRSSSLLDGWGQAFIYTPQEEGYATITSLGKDGRVGGVGDESDTTLKYSPITKDFVPVAPPE